MATPLNKSGIISKVVKIFKPIEIGIIIGFVYGLVLALKYISEQQYFHYELYNLILLTLKQSITTYSLIFILFSIAAAILIIVFGMLYVFIDRMYPALYQYLNKKVSIFGFISLITLLIIIYLFRFFSKDILAFLRHSNIFEIFGLSGKAMRESYMTVVNVLLISIGILILIKFKVFQRAVYRYNRISDHRVTKTIALTLFILILVLNLFIFANNKLNAQKGMNVLLISIDTLRADHLGAYGYERNTSPNIDKLAEKGVLFENAYSQAPWTLPSMASMITSLYPREHGAFNRKYKINNNLITLTEYMKNNSYNTIGVISNRFVGPKFGFDQGFDIMNEEAVELKTKTSELITDRAIEYLLNNGDDKFFIWLHYMDPHSEYVDHPEFDYSFGYEGILDPPVRSKTLNNIKEVLNREDIEHVKNLYDEEISYTDANIGRVIEALEESGKSDNTIIIITSDHGEEFLDKSRFGHGATLYEELIRVPLIIYVPSSKMINAKRSSANVEVRSIAKTITDLVGIKKTRLSGENLILAAEADKSDNTAYSLRLNGRVRFSEFEGIVWGDWKLIKNLTDTTYELFNLENDPLEKEDLIYNEEEQIKYKREDLISRLSGIKHEKMAEQQEAQLDEEDIKHLKTLGYIE